MPTISVVLVEDHALVRAGVRALLRDVPGIKVVAEIGNGREAIDLIRSHQPNVVLMDITMPGLNGLEVTSRVAREHPGIKVVILSMHANEEYVLQALQAGAAGYLLKDAATVELELAIKAVARGETYLGPAISKRVIEDYLARLGDDRGPLEHLTPRQREILQLIAEGKSTREIASLLNISVKTVETHRTQLMERLNIHDIAGLVRYAVRVGLIAP